MSEEEFAKFCMNKCNKVYDAMAEDFRRYVYRYCAKKMIRVNKSQELDDLIDEYYKFRLGFIDEMPMCRDEKLSDVLRDLIFGGEIPAELLEKLAGGCRKEGLNIKNILVRNASKKVSTFDIL